MTVFVAEEKEAKWAIASESRMRLDAMLAQASSEKPIADSGDGWDSDPWLLGVANGVVDLLTGDLREGKQGDRISPEEAEQLAGWMDRMLAQAAQHSWDAPSGFSPDSWPPFSLEAPDIDN